MCELDFAEPGALEDLMADAALLEEMTAAAWAIQGWIRSCFDVTGRCSLCGTGSPGAHINGCPWPAMRAVLDKTILPATLKPPTSAGLGPLVTGLPEV